MPEAQTWDGPPICSKLGPTSLLPRHVTATVLCASVYVYTHKYMCVHTHTGMSLPVCAHYWTSGGRTCPPPQLPEHTGHLGHQRNGAPEDEDRRRLHPFQVTVTGPPTRHRKWKPRQLIPAHRSWGSGTGVPQPPGQEECPATGKCSQHLTHHSSFISIALMAKPRHKVSSNLPGSPS